MPMILLVVVGSINQSNSVGLHRSTPLVRYTGLRRSLDTQVYAAR